MRKLFMVLLTVIMLAMMGQPASAAHGTYPVPSAHWPGGVTEGYVMVSNRSSIPTADVAWAMSVWDQSPAVKLVDVGPVCPNTFAPHYCLTIYSPSVLTKGGSGAQGYAVTHVPNRADRHILAADVYVKTGLSASGRRSVLLHEMGHGLGLNHRQDNATSIMRPWFNYGWGPDQHDYNVLVENRW